MTRRGALKVVGAAGVVGLGLGRVPTVSGRASTSQEAVPWLEARNAVIRVDVVGTYDYPDVPGSEEWATGGSGFIIDPSGVAVTNNHVVTGAATLEVFVGENTQDSYNAQVLGTSECSDLSVIQLRGNDFPALSFAPSLPSAGTEVYSHGFAINDDEVATTDGIVSRPDVSGESEWASVDSVVEHTAKINPGNSGGPLVNASGQVVGINYAAFLVTDQNHAIGSDVAQPIISTLRQGENMEYIGVNGVAIETATPMTPDGVNRAIHIVSVETGSPAYTTGIRAGDRLIRIENTRAVRPESRRPTKTFYCDVLRTRGSSNPIAVQLLRPVPGQDATFVLEGVVNGDPLRVVGII